MALLPSTCKALSKLIKAFGLEGKQVKKLVISCSVNEPIMLYFTGYVEREQLEKVADAFEVIQCQDVTVQDDGQIKTDDPVVVKPYGEKATSSMGREFI